ncbi:PfkB family carbohydrate kinase [Pseudooceanicola aestuarii]|uniref:PfkB family carbohydrate kinase n=1 Tax=Pseudooceanicola aestuarii TaxID=2697319 RepID=UPI0013D622EA|nr:PfkB family carbohydrate kinase [Pseudooceanicola aestuarii]
MGALLQMTGPVVDLVYNVTALPLRGQEARCTGFAMCSGGGFNAMAAARAAGQRVVLGGSLGSGPLADRVADDLARLGIETARPRLSQDQGCCTVLLEPDGERSFVGYPGAEGAVRAENLVQIDLSGVSQVLLSGYSLHYPKAARALVDWVAALPNTIMLAFDPSPVVHLLDADLLRRVLRRADWVSANASEAAGLTGKDDPQVAAKVLAQDRQGALVRMGGDGCLLAQESVQPIAPHAVDPVDTNGAGDTHIGSFLAELSHHGDPLRAARYANIAAALSTLRQGPATPPDRNAVEAIFNDDKAGQRPSLNQETRS